MDIICAKCGKHFSSIEGAREHRGHCKETSKDEPIRWKPARNSKITSEEWENLIKLITPQDVSQTTTPSNMEPTAKEPTGSEDATKSDITTPSTGPTDSKESSPEKKASKSRNVTVSTAQILRWSIALILILALSIIGLGISIFSGNFIPFWLLFVFSLVYSVEKWFFYITRKYKGIGYLYRLLLNLCILAVFGLIIWSGINLFSQQFVYSSLAGSLIFLAEFIFFIWMWRVVSKNSWRWPSMKLTLFSLTVIFIIFAFAGVPPMSVYKDNLFARLNTPTVVTPEVVPTTSYPEPELIIPEPKVILLKDIENIIFSSINTLRENEGIITLSWSDFWHEEAKKHSEYMAQTGDYKRPRLSDYENVFYCVAYSAENVPKYAIRSWAEREIHAVNLLTDNATHCGVGLAKRDNYYYVTFIATREAPVSQEVELTPSVIPIPASPEPKPAPVPPPKPEPTAVETLRPGARDILADINFDQIDQHAMNTPESVTDSIEKLAAYLTEPAENDLEKARAIYRWITQNIAYDVESFFSGSYKSTNPENVLVSRSSICHGYSNLFERLGKQVGLEVITISGWAKGYSYSIGEPIIGGTNHAWNAIKMNEGWYLIDSTWGAGAVSSDGTFNKRFVSNYFCTTPEQFVYAHLPEDKDWQLLETPISKDEYENLPGTSRSYIEYNCYLYSPLEVNLSSGEVFEFKIKCSEASKVALVQGESFFHLKRVGDIFQGNIKVREGEVILAVSLPGSNTYWPVVEYKVVPSD